MESNCRTFWTALIQLRRTPEVAELSSLLMHQAIEFWGDFDLEMFRIYRSLLNAFLSWFSAHCTQH